MEIGTPYTCRAEYALPETASDELKDFLAMMIQPDAAKRCTAEDAMKHPWVLADDQTEEHADVCLSLNLPTLWCGSIRVEGVP